MLLFPFMLRITESAPFQPRRRAYRWRKSCSTRSKGSCVQSGVRCRGGAFVGITSPVKCKNSADSMALSISVTVCHCAGVGRASTKVSNRSASSRSSARTNSGLHRPGHIAHIRLCAVMEQAIQCHLVRFTTHQRLSGASQRVLPHGVKYREMAVGASHQRLGVGNIPHIQIRRHRVVRVKMPPGVGRNRFVYTVASG